MAGGIIDVKHPAFQAFIEGMYRLSEEFDSHLGAVAENSVTTGGGQLPGSTDLMGAETEARNKLAVYMTAVSDGVKGYQSAGTNIGTQYVQLGELTESTMRVLLKPSDAPPRQDMDFDLEWLREQQQHGTAGGS